ncbi:PH domain-containing protein [Pyrococcus kukulkanii]|uniref:PH domain-containing protein n=1 Tax=Pyrococcus kukulkanii TaxID=1609559 RepID=A0ABV4T7V0_9EURY
MRCPKGLDELLYPREECIFALKQRICLEAKCKWAIFTNMRFIFYDPSIIGYKMRDVPYAKMRRLKFSSGLFFASVMVESESGDRVWVTMLKKPPFDEFMDFIVEKLNEVAIEPVRVTSGRTLVWKRFEVEKPKESIVRATSGTADDIMWDESVGVRKPETARYMSEREVMEVVSKIRDPFEAVAVLKELREEGRITAETYERVKDYVLKRR